MAANSSEGIDSALTTWKGARRDQLRRWSQMSLREMILALEEMEELADRLARTNARESARQLKLLQTDAGDG